MRGRSKASSIFVVVCCFHCCEYLLKNAHVLRADQQSSDRGRPSVERIISYLNLIKPFGKESQLFDNHLSTENSTKRRGAVPGEFDHRDI